MKRWFSENNYYCKSSSLADYWGAEENDDFQFVKRLFFRWDTYSFLLPWKMPKINTLFMFSCFQQNFCEQVPFKREGMNSQTLVGNVICYLSEVWEKVKRINIMHPHLILGNSGSVFTHLKPFPCIWGL